MQGRSPAQVYALLFGVTLVGAGVIGFLYSSDFGEPGKVDGVLGILDVNGWHNVVHIATGLIGLGVSASYGSARAYAIGLGAVYVAIAIWGFIAGDGSTLLSIIPVNTADNFLHLLIGIAGLGAGFATPAIQPPTTVAAPPEAA
ncbi:MAG TPA: DUF4383 domain-containing protein [Thermoleophilaceae bacterium]|nr:DUF4383 domain-containing protein [Thermoleophilaceae bacterium]